MAGLNSPPRPTSALNSESSSPALPLPLPPAKSLFPHLLLPSNPSILSLHVVIVLLLLLLLVIVIVLDPLAPLQPLAFSLQPLPAPPFLRMLSSSGYDLFFLCRHYCQRPCRPRSCRRLFPRL